jgi:hypothetical protein
MKSFKEYQDQVGLKPYSEIESDVPEVKYVYFAYKLGVTSKHDSMAEARKVSSNTEKVADEKSKSAHEEFWAARRALEAQAVAAWYDDLRSEYHELNDKQFQHIHAEAYDDAHSGGYDDVASKFEDLAEFIEKFVSLK